MDCNECCKKPQCRKLCAEAEAYADQNYVGRREMVLDPSLFDKMPKERTNEVKVDSRKSSKKVILSHREWEILTLLIVTKDEEFYNRCVQVLEITKGTARYHFHGLRKRLISMHH